MRPNWNDDGSGPPFDPNESTNEVWRTVEALKAENAQLKAACAEMRESLRTAADNAYVKAIELSKRKECLGQEAKMASGEFGPVELAALIAVARHIGFHIMAHDFLNQLPKEAGKGWLSPEKAQLLITALKQFKDGHPMMLVSRDKALAALEEAK